MRLEPLEDRRMLGLGDLLHTLDAPPSPQADARFGYAVAADGDLTVVGAPYADIGGVANTGAAYVLNSTTGELVAEADHQGVITHAITGAVVDPHYPLALAIEDLVVDVADDEGLPTVTLSLDTTSIAENGGVATVTAQLSAVAAKDVTVGLGLSGTAEHGTLCAENAVVPYYFGAAVCSTSTRAQTFTVTQSGILERVGATGLP